MEQKIEQKKRTFKILRSEIGFTSPSTQYYKGKEPCSVAKKFGTMLFKMINDKNSKYYKYSNLKTIKIIIRETTKHSLNKIYFYEVQQDELKKPVIRKSPNGNEIRYQYKTIVKTFNSNEEFERIISTPSPQKKSFQKNKKLKIFDNYIFLTKY